MEQRVEQCENSIGIKDLPMTFEVKYLGFKPAKGLWGIKHTRKPVSEMVQAARSLQTNEVLPFVKIEVTKDSFKFQPMQGDKKSKGEPVTFNIDTISYGVQDLIYTRVFCMIVVKEKDANPFLCHGFVCDSKNQARQLTYALAAAFQHFANKTKEENNGKLIERKFAIDLRTTQEMEADEELETDA